jgi:hypothetical protein
LAFAKTCWFCLVKNFSHVQLVVWVVVCLLQPNCEPMFRGCNNWPDSIFDRWSRIFYPLSKTKLCNLYFIYTVVELAAKYVGEAILPNVSCS